MHGCISGLILHGAFQTKFLGILYHKLSTFMVIRRGPRSLKGHFRIFAYLEKFFIMTRAPLWHHGKGIHLYFSVMNWSWGLIFFMRDRSYQWLKGATSFDLISDKSTEILGSEYWKSSQFSILAAWLT